jgi:hypothetical protein
VCGAACECVMCGEGGVVRGVNCGVGGRASTDVAGMVYGVGVWYASCVLCVVWVHGLGDAM